MPRGKLEKDIFLQHLQKMQTMSKKKQQDFLRQTILSSDKKPYASEVFTFLTAVISERYYNVQKNLEHLANTEVLSMITDTNRIALATNYYQALSSAVETKKPSANPIGDKQAEVMITYLEAIRYSKELHKDVQLQSDIISKLATIIIPNTPPIYECALETQSDYLSQISNATNYTLYKIGILRNYSETSVIVLPNLDNSLGRTSHGAYYQLEKKIELYPHAEIISSLKHEKAHDFSLRKLPHAHNSNHHDAWRLSQNVSELFKENTDDDTAFRIYEAEPEERFAKYAQTASFFSENKITINQFSEIFMDAPKEFDSLKEKLNQN